MKNYITLIALFLLGTTAIYSMDDSIQYSDSSSEGYESCEEEETIYDKGTVLAKLFEQHVLTEHLAHMKPLADYFSEFEFKWTPSLCEVLKTHISVANFPNLMILLNECISIIQDREVIFPGDSAMEGPYTPENNEKLRQSHLDRQALQNHVSKKHYTAYQLVDMLNMMDFLEMRLMRETLLNELIVILICLSDNQEYHTRDSFIHDLNATYHNNLKQRLIEEFINPRLQGISIKSAEFKTLIETARRLRQCNLQEVFNKLCGSQSKCTIL